jgi:hypothetical protein
MKTDGLYESETVSLPFMYIQGACHISYRIKPRDLEIFFYFFSILLVSKIIQLYFSENLYNLYIYEQICYFLHKGSKGNNAGSTWGHMMLNCEKNDSTVCSMKPRHKNNHEKRKEED